MIKNLEVPYSIEYLIIIKSIDLLDFKIFFS